MSEKLPDLSADSRALLEAGRSPESVPADVRARLWGQISSAMLAAPSLPLPHAPQLVPVAPTTVGGGKALLAVKLACSALGFAGAAALVVLAARHASHSGPQRVSVAASATPARAIPPAEAPIPAPMDVPILAPVPPIGAPERERPIQQVIRRPTATFRAHSPAPVPAPPVSPSTVGEDLEAERALIAQARSALQRGAPLDALTALRTHEEHFRAGGLAQERDALRIEALLASGDRAAAEAAAAQFARTYPQGLMGPAVRATLRSEPRNEP